MGHLVSTVISLVVEELARILIRFIKAKMGIKPTYKTYQNQQQNNQYKKAYR